MHTPTGFHIQITPNTLSISRVRPLPTMLATALLVVELLAVAVLAVALSPAHLRAASDEGGEKLPRIAVLEFRLIDVDAATGAVVLDRLRSDLVATKRFTVLDRTQTDIIMAELAHQQIGLTDPGTATKIGEQFNVQRIVTGRVANLVELNIIQMNVEMIDLRTAQIVMSETITHDGAMKGFILRRVPEVADRLAGISRPGTSAPSVSSGSQGAPAIGSTASGAELFPLLNGRSIAMRDGKGRKFLIGFKGDGSAAFTARRNGKPWRGEGKWWVMGDLLCMKWKKVRQGKKACGKVARVDNELYKIVHRSGKERYFRLK